MGVDLEHDDLSFYPLLYWPMDPREKNLSPAALSQASPITCARAAPSCSTPAT